MSSTATRSVGQAEPPARGPRRADPQLEASIQSVEIAFHMQTEAPDAFDIAKESEATRARYGDGDFGRGCLMALRLIERGVPHGAGLLR
jgi:hypothetical protein